MLLQRLVEYANERMSMSLPPRLYSKTHVRYIIDLDLSGKLTAFSPTDTADPKNRQNKRGKRRIVPQVQRASGIRPLLLADKADYTLGLGGEKAKPERVASCHQAYLELLERCAQTTGAAEVQAVLTFLTNDPTAQLQLPPEFDYGALITFCVDGVFPTELPTVQAFWAAEHDPAAHGAPEMQCIVCGNRRPVLKLLQGKVKGIPGGQTAGMAIISANADAFESYGLKASLIAPTCADCGERFTQAINELLSSEHSRVIMANAAFIFWTRETVEFDFRAPLNSPDAAQVEALITSVRSGHWVPEVDDTAFYATTLSASGGRVVVRDWIDTTVGHVKRSLARWFERQHIISNDGTTTRKPLGIYGLAGATVRELRDVPTPTVRTLLRAAMLGTPLPTALLAQALRRCRADQDVTRPRAALIKLVLLSHHSEDQENSMTELDTHHSDTAYLCGRLLAVLAEIQRNAIGKATLIDRFYGTASSAPASVLPRLLRGARPHLTKLDRDRQGTAVALEKRLEEIMHGIERFPNTLKLKEQGVFALGFYHERADRRRGAAEYKAKQAAAAQQEMFTDENDPTEDNTDQ